MLQIATLLVLLLMLNCTPVFVIGTPKFQDWVAILIKS